MTMGAKLLPSFAVPKGCIRNNNIKMVQDIPTMAEEVMSSFTTFKPWMAPKTDWAGVNIPSAIIKQIPIIARNLSAVFAKVLFSKTERTHRFGRFNSFAKCLLHETR